VRAAGHEGTQSLEKTQTGCGKQKPSPKGKGGNVGNFARPFSRKPNSSEFEAKSQYYCSDKQYCDTHREFDFLKEIYCVIQIQRVYSC